MNRIWKEGKHESKTLWVFEGQTQAALIIGPKFYEIKVKLS